MSDKIKASDKTVFPFMKGKSQLGLTLEQYFAGQALIGLLSNPSDFNIGNADRAVTYAFTIADKMCRHIDWQAECKANGVM